MSSEAAVQHIVLPTRTAKEAAAIRNAQIIPVLLATKVLDLDLQTLDATKLENLTKVVDRFFFDNAIYGKLKILKIHCFLTNLKSQQMFPEIKDAQMGTAIAAVDGKITLYWFRPQWKYRGYRRSDGILTRSKLENLLVTLCHEMVHILMWFDTLTPVKCKQKDHHGRYFRAANAAVQGAKVGQWEFDNVTKKSVHEGKTT